MRGGGGRGRAASWQRTIRGIQLDIAEIHAITIVIPCVKLDVADFIQLL